MSRLSSRSKSGLKGIKRVKVKGFGEGEGFKRERSKLCKQVNSKIWVKKQTSANFTATSSRGVRFE